MKPIDDAACTLQVRALAQELLESAGSDAPGPKAMRRTAAALGIPAAVLSRAVEAAAGAGGATAVTAGLGAVPLATGAAAKLGVLAPLVPWFVGGLVAASLAAGGAYLRGDWRSGKPSDGNAAVGLSESWSARQAPRHQADGPAPRGETLHGIEHGLPAGPVRHADKPGSTLAGAGQPRAGERASRAASFEALARPEPSESELLEPPRAPARALEAPDSPPMQAYPTLNDLSPPPVSASSTPARENASPDQLAREVALLDSARALVASRQLQAARAALDRYKGQFPGGVLRAEALALSVDLALRVGNEQEARRAIEQLERSFPNSQHLERFSALRRRR